MQVADAAVHAALVGEPREAARLGEHRALRLPVTATSGSVHVDVPVTITIPPANAVIVSPSTVALLVTQTQQLTGTVTDAGGHTIPGTIAWQSSNTAVATVTAGGLVTALLARHRDHHRHERLRVRDFAA